jgi:hypothetical protein
VIADAARSARYHCQSLCHLLPLRRFLFPMLFSSERMGLCPIATLLEERKRPSISAGPGFVTTAS